MCTGLSLLHLLRVDQKKWAAVAGKPYSFALAEHLLCAWYCFCMLLIYSAAAGVGQGSRWGGWGGVIWVGFWRMVVDLQEN